MFIGHFAVGFAAKKIDPKPSLGVYFIAAQFVDLLWPLLLLFGAENVRIEPGITRMTPLDFYNYPITHSLVGALIWSVLGGALGFYFYRKNSTALLLGACVFSHWVLDLLVHRPDLPLLSNSGVKVGLGLWNSPAVAVPLELGIFSLGLWAYAKSTHAKDRVGSYGLAGLAVFLVVMWIGNIMGPPPPSVEMISWAGNLQWIFVIWGFWIDRHRTSLAHKK